MSAVQVSYTPSRRSELHLKHQISKLGFLLSFPTDYCTLPEKLTQPLKIGLLPPKKKTRIVFQSLIFCFGENVSFRKSKALEICFTQQKSLTTQPTLQTWERFFLDPIAYLAAAFGRQVVRIQDSEKGNPLWGFHTQLVDGASMAQLHRPLFERI